MSAGLSLCPVCESARFERLVTLTDMPTLPNAVCETVVEAREMSRGELALELCVDCGHLFNSSFDAELLAYDARYENSLHFSPTFQEWISGHAEGLVARNQLAGGQALELGAGSGDFLDLLCQAGMAKGQGFDPSYSPDRVASVQNPAVSMNASTFPTDGSVSAELVCSRHVLEHLEDPVGVVHGVSQAMAVGGVAYHEVPNGDLMVRDMALWDLIYEHISYFSASSIHELCRRAGLAPSSIAPLFGDQFLGVEARTGSAADTPPPALDAARVFGDKVRHRVGECEQELAVALVQGPVVLWGAGSKGTSYLNLIDTEAQVAGVVDLNPRKKGTFVAGTTHEINGPEAVEAIQPATVLVANPIYLTEITAAVQTAAPNAQVTAIW